VKQEDAESLTGEALLTFLHIIGSC